MAAVDERIHDVLGIGFGPSNLALAIAIEEHNRTASAADRLNGAFFERQAAFGWHQGNAHRGHTHGLTSSLLSNGSVRAGEIRDSIRTRRQAPRPARDYVLTRG
ncbi:SidA/IucD/PvdA family monooxygenase [Saccharopolyspora pogona]|uniref:SidA/IucD/PvdA family monooxygenase n=1 Tax=Saccharopolyspora pogona TaxID=333966 RepID=UPI0037CA0D13